MGLLATMQLMRGGICAPFIYAHKIYAHKEFVVAQFEIFTL